MQVIPELNQNARKPNRAEKDTLGQDKICSMGMFTLLVYGLRP